MGLGEKEDLERVDDLDQSFFLLEENKNKYCDNLKENEEKKNISFRFRWRNT